MAATRGMTIKSYNFISKDFVKLLTIKTNGKTRRFDCASVIIK